MYSRNCSQLECRYVTRSTYHSTKFFIIPTEKVWKYLQMMVLVWHSSPDVTAQRLSFFFPDLEIIVSSRSRLCKVTLWCPTSERALPTLPETDNSPVLILPRLSIHTASQKETLHNVGRSNSCLNKSSINRYFCPFPTHTSHVFFQSGQLIAPRRSANH
jgi:hypothetical protein